jgi:hypothetical protein
MHNVRPGSREIETLFLLFFDTNLFLTAERVKPSVRAVRVELTTARVSVGCSTN